MLPYYVASVSALFLGTWESLAMFRRRTALNPVVLRSSREYNGILMQAEDALLSCVLPV
jgi:hypothetical protein